MENIFETNSQATAEFSFKDPVEKPKRNAFVFITADSNQSHFALEDLKKMTEVREVYVARGAYDLVAKVSGESFDELRNIVETRIRNVNGVKSTLTLTLI